MAFYSDFSPLPRSQMQRERFRKTLFQECYHSHGSCWCFFKNLNYLGLIFNIYKLNHAWEDITMDIWLQLLFVWTVNVVIHLCWLNISVGQTSKWSLGPGERMVFYLPFDGALIFTGLCLEYVCVMHNVMCNKYGICHVFRQADFLTSIGEKCLCTVLQ